jgi:hypothetical protein
MRIVTAIQDGTYLLWQAELLYYNCIELGFDCTILIASEAQASDYAKALADHTTAKIFRDIRENKDYAASVQPYLLNKYSSSMHGDEILVCDSDVLFKSIAAIRIPEGNQIIASNCSEYLDARYVDGCDPDILTNMCDICGVDIEMIRNQSFAPGAQFVFGKDFDHLVWDKIEKDTVAIHNYLKSVKCSIRQIQVWTACMWGIWFNLINNEIIHDASLDFCWATDSKQRWDECNLLHMAGVMPGTIGAFYKGSFAKETPFKYSMKHVWDHTCSRIYADYIVKYSENRKLNY